MDLSINIKFLFNNSVMKRPDGYVDMKFDERYQ